MKNIITSNYYKIILSVVITFTAVFSAMSQDVDHWETAVFESDTWKYLVPTSAVSDSWRSLDYNDTAWESGVGGFGYGDGDDATIIWTTGAKPTSVYLRKIFNITDTSKISLGVLNVDYDDAFVAYLNGVEIGRAGLTTINPAYNELGANHDASMYSGGSPDQFYLDEDLLKSAMQNGDNVLCVQVHNSSTSSSDMSSRVFLSFGIKDNSTYFRSNPSWFVAPEAPGEFKTNLPLILISTAYTIPDDPKVTANMKIIYHEDGSLNSFTDEPNVYDGYIGIERRGASSYNYPQRPYALETRDELGMNLDTSLLGMPTENDWVLLSHSNERTFSKNILSHRLFTEMGHYAPRIRLAEVFMNDDYQGVYMFGEKVKQSKGRVDIAKLALKDTVGVNLTGGYIFKTDYDDGYGTYWTSNYSPINRPGAAVKFVYYDPKSSIITHHQKTYIAGYIDMLETVLYSDMFPDPTYGYRAYIDVESFIDYFIISEISRNVDGYKKSRYFHKDKDSKNSLVHSGPTWDYDWAWKNLGLCNQTGNDYSTGWAYKINECNPWPAPPSWVVRMLQDPTFANAVNARYFTLRNTILSDDYMYAIIDSVADLLGDGAQVRHYKKYNIGSSFSSELSSLKEWITRRMHWLDENMLGKNITKVVDAELIPRLRIFPNPVQRTLFVESDNNVRQIVLTNIMGMMIKTVNPTELSTGIDLSQFNAGIYMVKVTLESGKSYTQKIVKQ